MRVNIIVTLKSGMFDPQGVAILGSLQALGCSGILNVHQGKFFELDIDADSQELAKQQAREACERLLANAVIENYRIEFPS